MQHSFRITIKRYHKFESGVYCIMGTPDYFHDFITSDFVANIYVGDFISRPLSMTGQERAVRSINSPYEGDTIIRTNDNLDDIVPYLGKLPIIVEGYLPTVQ